MTINQYKFSVRFELFLLSFQQHLVMTRWCHCHGNSIYDHFIIINVAIIILLILLFSTTCCVIIAGMQQPISEMSWSNACHHSEATCEDTLDSAKYKSVLEKFCLSNGMLQFSCLSKTKRLKNAFLCASIWKWAQICKPSFFFSFCNKNCSQFIPQICDIFWIQCDF